MSVATQAIQDAISRWESKPPGRPGGYRAGMQMALGFAEAAEKAEREEAQAEATRCTTTRPFLIPRGTNTSSGLVSRPRFVAFTLNIGGAIGLCGWERARATEYDADQHAITHKGTRK